MEPLRTFTPSIFQKNIIFDENNFSCPLCKAPFKQGKCSKCCFIPANHHGIPVFYTSTDISKRYEAIATFYDDLYNKMGENAWEKIANRDPAFIAFIAQIVSKYCPKRYLDIGCGQAQLLTAVKVAEKYGLEISRTVLDAGKTRNQSTFCVGFAEEMPFADNYFDCISIVLPNYSFC